MIRYACGHCRSDAKRAVDSDEIVMREVEPQRRNKVIDAFGERIGERVATAGAVLTVGSSVDGE